MKKICWSVLGSLLATPVVACDLCSIYSATQARGEIGKGFHVSFAEQFTHFGTLQENGVKVPNGAGQFFDSSISQIVAGYIFTERFGVQLNLPIIHRSFRRLEGAELERGSESGAGDLALIGTFQMYRRQTRNATFAWNVLGGVKFPTGSSGRLAEELEELAEPEPPGGALESGIHGHDLALGSGSYDGIIGTSVFLREKRFFWSASMQYSIRAKGDFDYHFADDLAWSGGPGYFLGLTEDYTLAVQVNVSGETKGRDTFRGSRAEDTGLTAVYLGPQFTLTWKEQVSAEVGLDLPVSISNSALQAVPDFRVRAGITWRF